MVPFAQQRGVGQAGLALVGRPFQQMMDVAPVGGGGAAGEHAVSVALLEGPADGGGGAALFLPDIQGKPWATVQKQLDAIGFSYGSPLNTAVYNDSVAPGNVISVKPPAGTKIAP